MSDDPTKNLRRTPDERFDEILNRLDRFETSVDQRLKQTTPLSAQLAELLEQMQTGFREASERQDRLEREFGERLGQIEKEMRESGEGQDRIEKEMREINRTLRRVNVDLATALRDQDELGDRVTALETQMSQP